MKNFILYFSTSLSSFSSKAWMGYFTRGYRIMLLLQSEIKKICKRGSIAKMYFPGRRVTINLTALFFMCICSLSAFSQINKKPEPGISKVVPSESPFPQSFIGNWKGQLQWMVAGKPTQLLTMQLGIQPTDVAGEYTWQIIYGDSVVENRPYLLKAVDMAKGHWIIDEKDGIILNSYVHGNAIHGAFTVEGKTIVDNYRIEKDQLLVEFFTIDLKDKKRSGKGTEKTPFVDSYRMGSYQMGILYRVK